jgi:hypothetical protein
VAAGYAFEAKASAFERTMFFHRLSGVLRTTREKAAAAPKKRADCVFVDAKQCQQQQFHRLIVQVRSFCPANPGFLLPGRAGRVVQVWPPGAVSGRAKVAGSASSESAHVPVAGSGFDPPNGARAVWQQPAPSGHPALLQPPEGGNVTGNERSSAPS